MNLTKKQRSKAEARVKDALTAWSNRLGLRTEWRVDYVFNWEETPESKIGGGTVGATTHTDLAYLRADIDWYMLILSRLSDEKLDELVVHELCHIMLADMGQHMPEAEVYNEERVATRIARRFVWMWKDHDEFGHPKWDEK